MLGSSTSILNTVGKWGEVGRLEGGRDEVSVGRGWGWRGGEGVIGWDWEIKDRSGGRG